MMATHEKATTKTPVPTIATMRLSLRIREQQLHDLEARLRKEADVNAAFDFWYNLRRNSIE